MTEKKNVTTEVQALDHILNMEIELPENIREKLQHMRDVRAKKRETDDSCKLANMELGKQFTELWEDETFKASDVMEVLNLKNTSKANAVCKAMGWEKVPTTEKVNIYKF